MVKGKQDRAIEKRAVFELVSPAGVNEKQGI